MMVREFLETRAGKITAVAVCAVSVVVLFFVVRGGSRSEAMQLSRYRTFICAETGKTFEVDATDEFTVPARSPFTKRETGYPAEMCYWTADGQAKKKPTAVLLRIYAGEEGPTFCPDCGRLVVGHNPEPQPGRRPPPTREEYEQRRARRAAPADAAETTEEEQR